ncbi:MAG: hypothetical protein ACRDSP_01980 [Pseudonocardiaceae bacterium]
MTDEQVQRLAAALRAQASGFPAAPAAPEQARATPEQEPPSAGHRSAQDRSGLPAWTVLALAVLLGALAGGLAGVISAW